MVISKGGRFSLLYRGLASECYRLYKLNPVFLKYFEFEPSRVQTKKKQRFRTYSSTSINRKLLFDSPLDLALVFL